MSVVVDDNEEIPTIVIGKDDTTMSVVVDDNEEIPTIVCKECKRSAQSKMNVCDSCYSKIERAMIQADGLKSGRGR